MSDDGSAAGFLEVRFEPSADAFGVLAVCDSNYFLCSAMRLSGRDQGPRV